MFQEAMKRLTQLLSKDLGKELYELWEVSASGGLRGAWEPGAGGVGYEAQQDLGRIVPSFEVCTCTRTFRTL